MAKHLETGKLGEKIACGYLVENHYKILGHNYSQSFGEIDLIALNRAKTLVFIEVKTIHMSGQITAKANTDNYQFFKPEDHLTVKKYNNLKKTCQVYIDNHSNLLKKSNGWQIDLLALTIYDKNCLVKHFKNI